MQISSHSTREIESKLNTITDNVNTVDSKVDSIDSKIDTLQNTLANLDIGGSSLFNLGTISAWTNSDGTATAEIDVTSYGDFGNFTLDNFLAVSNLTLVGVCTYYSAVNGANVGVSTNTTLNYDSTTGKLTVTISGTMNGAQLGVTSKTISGDVTIYLIT